MMYLFLWATLDKSSIKEKEKEKWRNVLVPELMSSDDSDGDSIVVQNHPWRSSTLDNFFYKFDEQLLSNMSSQATRQMKKRILDGAESSRPKPVVSLPVWKFTKQCKLFELCSKLILFLFLIFTCMYACMHASMWPTLPTACTFFCLVV